MLGFQGLSNSIAGKIGGLFTGGGTDAGLAGDMFTIFLVIAVPLYLNDNAFAAPLRLALAVDRQARRISD
jgi:hypothetical protein